MPQSARPLTSLACSGLATSSAGAEPSTDSAASIDLSPLPPIVAPLLEMGFSLKHVQKAIQSTGKLTQV